MAKAEAESGAAGGQAEAVRFLLRIRKKAPGTAGGAAKS
jgi:hypothetical protein